MNTEIKRDRGITSTCTTDVTTKRQPTHCAAVFAEDDTFADKNRML
jgi:hypothetical protein